MDSQTTITANSASGTSSSSCKCCQRKDALPLPISADPSKPCAIRENRHWPRKFVEGQTLNIKSWNRSYIDALKSQWETSDDEGDNDPDESDGDSLDGGDSGEEDDESNDEADGVLREMASSLKEEDTSVARIFMRGTLYRNTATSEITERYYGQITTVESFCEHIGLEDFEDRAPIQETRRCVLLDERAASGEFRASMGRMNYAQLYKTLRAVRFTMERSPQTRSQSGCLQRTTSLPPNADQRRLYIHNITPHNAATLMVTTSVHEAQTIRDLLHLHLARETEIRASIRSIGFRTFTFVLSLPYYIMEQQNRPTTPDKRGWPFGQPLRKSVNISMPDKLKSTYTLHTNNDVDFVKLYEAQTTLAITGLDESRWTATGLIDSNRAEDSVANYQSKALTGGMMHRQDPISRGRIGTECAINPRLYFLRAWEARIDQVETEWDGIVKFVARANVG